MFAHGCLAYLVDSGDLDTHIKVARRGFVKEFVYSHEFAANYRNQNGTLDCDSELFEIAIDDYLSY